MSRKVLINVAPVAASCKHIDPEAIAADVLQCREKGAAMVHLHVRTENGSLTADTSLLERTLELLRKQSDIIIEVSTGGVSDLTISERCAPVPLNLVEACSLNVGSTNLGSAVYINRQEDVEYCVQELLRYQKIPEVETFEIGHTHTMLELMKRYSFQLPVLFSVVLGHHGAAPATEQALNLMVQMFPHDGSTAWGITHFGRRDWNIVAKALQLGACTVRVGFEDSNYVDPDHTTELNYPLVAKAVEVLKENGCEPMTPDEARSMFHIK